MLHRAKAGGLENAITFAVMLMVYGCCPAQLDLHTLRHTLRPQVPAAFCFWQRSEHVRVLLVRTRGQRYLQLVRFSKERSTKSRFLFPTAARLILIALDASSFAKSLSQRMFETILWRLPARRLASASGMRGK